MSSILHVTNIYFSLSYFIGEQFLYFSKKGYRLHVICSPSELLDNYAEQMNFSYSEININRAITPYRDILAIFRICLYIKRNRIDIVVGHTPKGALLSMIAAMIMRVPKRIYFRHGLVYETSTGYKRKILLNIDRLTAYCSHVVVCVSPSLYKTSIDDRLNRVEKQIILGKGTCGGVDTKNKFNINNLNKEKLCFLRNKLGIGNDTFVIGFCGRIVRDKGINELIEAFDKIRIHHPEKHFCLLLVGMFEERDTLSVNMINKVKTDIDIVYTGFVNDNIEYYYALMNLFILPSYREGFPISVLEASSMNLPVLTTRVTGCIDSIIDLYTGVFVGNNSASILDGLEYYLSNPDLLNMHGENGRRFVEENFEQTLMWPIIENLYL